MNRLLKVAVCMLTVVLVSLSGLMSVFVLGDGYFTAIREYPKQGRLLSLSDVPQDRSDRTLNALLDAADTDVLLADEPTGVLDHTLRSPGTSSTRCLPCSTSTARR
ncbi:hypothetical protein [Bifidobacterium biavatii]|uniref:hypothetical protein n=1 Tax=Bifidobacterium biavatii TaxID=762212 RepID=UPI000529890C|nr:hypothetical protein [Bifidobacterium biavatii]